MLASLSRCRFGSHVAAPLLNPSERIFTNLYGDQGSDLASAKARGDWTQTASFISKGREWIHGEVKTSEIRGRGGAGFSTGMKWSFVPKPSGRPHYLVINADEGEPGTCKDRQILTNEPHKLVEGALLSAFTIHAHQAYIYIRGEFRHEADQLQKAIDEAYAAGLIGKDNVFKWPFDFAIHRGAGAYVCGEETSLLNSIEGLPGRPRFKPPFPAVKGLFGYPTVINNVETISNVPTICGRSGKWFASKGVKNSRGTKLFGISGCVNHPCVVEDNMGVSLRELIEKHCGGVKGGWSNLQGIIPGGLSCPILSPAESETAIMSYDCMGELGSALGTGAVIVLDKSVDIVKAFARLAAFYKHESCGQCGPCRQGTAKLEHILAKIAEGKGVKSDLPLLEETATATTNCICALAGAASDPIRGLLKHFRGEIASRLK